MVYITLLYILHDYMAITPLCINKIQVVRAKTYIGFVNVQPL